MLNTNQSHKRNSWKYALIIPALIGFVFLFQIKVIAQEKEETTLARKMQSHNEVRVVVNKNSTDAEMKNDVAVLKKEYGITLKYSKVKRNSAGEITGIKVEFKDKNGNKGVSQIDGKEPIQPINFYKNDSGIGFGRPKRTQIITRYADGDNDNAPVRIIVDDTTDIVGNFDFNFDFDFDAPESPEAPEAPEAPESPELPDHIWNDSDTHTKIVVQKDGKKPLVILNGKVIEGDQGIVSEKELDEMIKKSSSGGKGYSYSIASNGKEKNIALSWTDAKKIQAEAMEKADIQMKRMRPQVEKQMELIRGQKEKVRAEMERVRSQMERTRADMQSRKPDFEAAQAEMAKAKEEMVKAKAEMEAAKAEYEKAKAEISKGK